MRLPAGRPSWKQAWASSQMPRHWALLLTGPCDSPCYTIDVGMHDALFFQYYHRFDIEKVTFLKKH